MENERLGLNPHEVDAAATDGGNVASSIAYIASGAIPGGGLIKHAIKKGETDDAVRKTAAIMTRDIKSAGPCPTCGASAQETLIGPDGQGQCIECHDSWPLPG